MKRTLLILISLLPISFCAQSYCALNSSSEYYFNSSYDPYYYPFHSLWGLKNDSVRFNGTDTSYFPYRTLAYLNTSNFCNVDPFYPTWAGTTIKIDTAQRHRFTTLNNDSVVISTNTFPGDTQVIFIANNGDRFIAIHQTTSYDLFVGINDSVKTYQLQKTNASGNLLSSWWNGQQIQFSKNNGVVRIMAIRDFPDDTMIMTRTNGKRLTYGDIYTWQAGDLLNDHKSSYGGPPNYSSEDWSYNRKILSRTQINTDSVSFLIRDVVHHTRNMPPLDVITTDTFLFNVGQLTRCINEEMPQQTIDSTHTYDLQLDDYDCGKLKMTDHIQNSVFNDSCIHYESFEPWIHDNVYEEGVGGYYFNEYPHFLNGYSTTQYDNTYYHLGTDTCGLPYFVNIIEHDVNKSLIHVYPNPAADELTLELGDRNGPYTLVITDLSGAIISTQTLSGNKLDVSAFASGVYFGTLRSMNSAGCLFFKFVRM